MDDGVFDVAHGTYSIRTHKVTFTYCGSNHPASPGAEPWITPSEPLGLSAPYRNSAPFFSGPRKVHTASTTAVTPQTSAMACE